MDFWANFWGVVLAFSLCIFAILAVVVAIGGFFDAKALFRNIDSQHAEENRDAEKN
jgi:hypothetical protein